MRTAFTKSGTKFCAIVGPLSVDELGVRSSIFKKHISLLGKLTVRNLKLYDFKEAETPNSFKVAKMPKGV